MSVVLYGCDVSVYQGAINWDEAAPTKDFVWYKGGGGDDGNYIDPKAADNLWQLQQHGKPHGCYWFAGNTDPVAEATYACANIWKDMNIGAWAILDVERSGGGLPSPAWVKTFLDTATGLLGFKPVVYMNQNTENSYDWSAVVTANYGLIIADYAVPPSGTVALKHWPFYAAQQYTSTGSVPGIGGNVDMDAFFGTLDQLLAYGRPAPSIAPPPNISPPALPNQETEPVIAPPPAQPVVPQTPVTNVKPDITPPPKPTPVPTVVTVHAPLHLNWFQRLMAWLVRIRL